MHLWSYHHIPTSKPHDLCGLLQIDNIPWEITQQEIATLAEDDTLNKTTLVQDLQENIKSLSKEYCTWNAVGGKQGFHSKMVRQRERSTFGAHGHDGRCTVCFMKPILRVEDGVSEGVAAALAARTD
jgi:hypothetical protein